MRNKLIAILAMALAPTVSVAASDMATNAEYKVRYNLMQNESFTKDNNQSAWEQRFKLGMTWRAGEKLSATVSLLHNSNWGADPADVGIATTDTTEDRFLDVNQAYATWMTSDDMSVVIGRQPIAFGDGTIFHQNDWEHEPYSFEGVGIAYDTEFAGINFWGVQIYDAGNTSDGGTRDREHNMYVFSVDVKNMPEFLKMLNVHIVKHAVNATSFASAPVTVAADVQQFGLTLQGASGMVDYRLTYSTATGEAGGADISANMLDGSVGYSLASFMNSHFELAFHQDSGDDGSGDVTSWDDLPNYYNLHENAGRMDLYRWGNLTYFKLGWHFDAMEKTTAGLDYYMFSKTEEDDTRHGAAGETNIGSEIDLYATKKYSDNLAVTARLGMFSPVEDTVGSSDAQTHVFLEGKFKF
ncbi:MAG: hypothetical protein CL677_09120 [Bdellovibrionaceae bacterium]|nr:hypothetical protein [Pseudobdellovibrionaceae bacterium]|tara:strand:+ start:31663 stop:32898 length:1236 start_codon:yes stop_codon:yes gene_type:complete